MVYNATVVYPNEEGATFDLPYYLETHMPLVMENWGKYGLKSYTVVQFSGALGGAASPYSIQCTLTWESKESVEKATSSPEAKNVFGDVPNFSNKGPTFLMGDIVGGSD